MPANLPPQYFEAEKRYRQAKTPEDKMEALEEMMAIMPHHKGTDKLRAELRRRMAKLSQEAERRPSTARTGGVYHVSKEGAGQVALAGLPNAGKSSLVAILTGAPAQAADYPYTTHTPTPGMLHFENIQIQLVDMPPLGDRDARPWLATVFRGADVLLLVVDLSEEAPAQVEMILEELAALRIRPFGDEPGQEEDESILRPAWKKALIVATKADEARWRENYRSLCDRYGEEFPILPVSAAEGRGLEELGQALYQALEVVRVYTKAPGQKPDLREPVVLRKGSTVREVAEAVHKDFKHRFKYAQLWGSGKYDGQRVSPQHVVADGDVLEFHV